MAIAINFRRRWGYIIAFFLLLTSYCLVLIIIGKLSKSASWVSHSYQVLYNLESIKGGITDAETGVRGYAITKDARFLLPYSTGSRRVPALVSELRSLTNDNPGYATRVDSLDEMIKKRLFDLSTFITKFQALGLTISDEMLAARDSNRVIMDYIRTLIQDLKRSEETLMAERNETLEDFFTTTKLITIVSLLVALITIVYSLLKFNREKKARQEADDNVRLYSKELEKRIHELNEANTALKELKSIEKFAATGRIAGTIAHEVRNPLTNISLSSEQLKEMTGGDGDAGILLDMITRNVSRINQLVGDLLNSTRFHHLDYTVTDINSLLDETIDMARDRLDLHHIKLVKEYADEICCVMADREKLKFAFLNIVINAIEAMTGKGGILTIRTRKNGNRCVVEIVDSGTGMDNETLQKLFDPYFTRKAKGSGLGLTNTQSIILTHKGYITVESDPGKGTKFIIYLNMVE